jgi:AsmA protein
MKRILLHPFFLLSVLLLIILTGGIIVLPNFVASQIRQTLQEQIGGRIAVAGQSQFVLSPQFGLALHDVSIAGASAMAEPIVSARMVIVPLKLSQIFLARSRVDRLIVQNADIDIVINGQGNSNVLVEGNPVAPKTDANSISSQPLKIQLVDSRLHFNDLRNGNDFEVRNIDALLEVADSLDIDGLAVVKEQRVHFKASLNSIARAFADGSPLDLNVDGVESSFSFSGRIATTDILNLAGQATVQSANAPRLWQWLGAKTTGLNALRKVSLTGAFDSLGPVIFFKDAELKLGEMNGTGNISFSNSGDRPNLTAALKFDVIDMNSYQSAQSSPALIWSDKPIDISLLSAIDAQFKLSSDRLIYGGLTTGAATIEGTLKDRVLKSSLKGSAVAGGAVELDVTYATQQLPPHLKFNAQVDHVDAKQFLSSVIGQTWLSGELTGTADFEADGESQAEMVSRLSGDVDASVAKLAIPSLEKTILLPMLSSAKAMLKASISDGIMTVGENSFGGSGEIDLLRQALSITVTAPNKQKILVTGQWSAPAISAIAPSLQ